MKSLLLTCCTALIAVAGPSTANAQFVTCPQTHNILAVVDSDGNQHYIDPAGTLAPAFSPAIRQGDLIEILVDAAAPPNTSAWFEAYNVNSSVYPFPTSGQSPLIDNGDNNGIKSYLVLVPYWMSLMPSPTMTLTLQQLGCASQAPRTMLPMSNEVTFTSGLDGPNSISAPWAITAVATGPTSIEVTWAQAQVTPGFNESYFEVVATPSDPNAPTERLLVEADENHAEIAGLLPGVRYEVAVYALDKNYVQVSSGLVEFPYVTTIAFGAAGSIKSTDVASRQNPVCAYASQSILIDGVLDVGDGVPGIVDGANTNPIATVDFPFDYIETPNTPRGFVVVPGGDYATDTTSGQAANAIIFIPAVSSCGPMLGARFIAVHLNVDVDGYAAAPVKMIAGTAFSRSGEIEGVVASTAEFYLNGLWHDPDSKEIWGTIGGTVVFEDELGMRYGANIELTVNGTPLRPDTDL